MRTHHRFLTYGPSFQALFILAALLMISGCATRLTPPPLPPAPIKFVPPPAPKPAVHVIKASWYGSGFAGRQTSSGERFRPDRLTAASKTLPLGSVVKVENPTNGHAVTVRINDCGPYVRGRSLDLSRGAAQKIGITHQGVARVKLTTLEVPPDAVPCSH
jgi:rare lipoprotein A (peptidoglycan hydrolase)